MGKIILTILILVLVIGLAIYWLFLRQVGEAKAKQGFLDYVKDPNALDRLDTEFAERETVVSELAKKSPTALVEMLLKDADEHGVPSRAIKAAGPKVVPALLAAVTDPRFRGGNQKRYGELPMEPLEAVLDCLQEYAPIQAVSVVTPLIKDESKEVRKEVALLLGIIANDEAASPIKQLLQDEDDYVRSYAVIGIRRAITANRISDGFRREVFDVVLPLAFRRSAASGDKIPSCLLELDREKAIAALTDPNCLKADQENLHNVLTALREANVIIDEALLFKILSELDGKGNEYPEEYVVGETLRMLAMINSEQARSAIQEGLKHPSQTVREYAAEALAQTAGVDTTLESLWEYLDQNGWQGLSIPQKHVLALRILINEVNNGGFFQYFFNSSGDYWRDAQEGFTAIGASGDKQLFEQVLQRFGSESPNEDREKRHTQISKIANRDEEAFEEIETVFYKDEDDREVLLLKYMLKNAGDFQKKGR